MRARLPATYPLSAFWYEVSILSPDLNPRRDAHDLPVGSWDPVLLRPSRNAVAPRSCRLSPQLAPNAAAPRIRLSCDATALRRHPAPPLPTPSLACVPLPLAPRHRRPLTLPDCELGDSPSFPPQSRSELLDEPEPCPADRVTPEQDDGTAQCRMIGYPPRSARTCPSPATDRQFCRRVGSP